MAAIEQVSISQAITKTDTVDDVESLVREHARLVYRVAYSVLRHPQDAEDAAQETFLRLMRHAAELPGVKEPRAWLARIAWRVAVDRRKKQVEQPLLDDTVTRLRDAAPGAEQQLIDEQMLALLHRLIELLPADLRDVLTLSTVREMSGAEIAAVLGQSEAVVRGRLFRARQALRLRLQALMGSDV